MHFRQNKVFQGQVFFLNRPLMAEQIQSMNAEKSTKHILANFNLFEIQLWEESQAENVRLRLDMNSIRSDLDSTRHQLEAAIQVCVLSQPQLSYNTTSTQLWFGLT